MFLLLTSYFVPSGDSIIEVEQVNASKEGSLELLFKKLQNS